MSVVHTTLSSEDLLQFCAEKGIDQKALLEANLVYLASLAMREDLGHYLRAKSSSLRGIRTRLEPGSSDNLAHTFETMLSTLPTEISNLVSKMASVGILDLQRGMDNWVTIQEILLERDAALQAAHMEAAAQTFGG